MSEDLCICERRMSVANTETPGSLQIYVKNGWKELSVQLKPRCIMETQTAIMFCHRHPFHHKFQSFSHAMKTDSIGLTAKKLVRFTPTMLAYNIRPLSVPVTTVSLQTRSKRTSVIPITAKGMSKTR